jgi:hypothetical protein
MAAEPENGSAKPRINKFTGWGPSGETRPKLFFKTSGIPYINGID